PGQLDIRLLELGNPDYYRAMIAAEAYYAVKPEERGLPTMLINDQFFIGEERNRQEFPKLVEAAINGAAIDFPVIEGLDPNALLSIAPQPVASAVACSADNPEACDVANPIYVAYFYKVGCKECNRVDADLTFLRSQYPNLIVQEFNILEDVDLALWMARRAGRTDENNITAPAVFIGDKGFLTELEITPEVLETEFKRYENTGSPAFWEEYNKSEGIAALIDKFKTIEWPGIMASGLIDGLNPCAFATIIFFISYLTISGRKGKEILITGACFTIGIFLAYFLIGIALYKVMDLIKDQLAIAGKILYGLIAIACLYMAYMSIRDYFKVRKGDLTDMEMKLPEPLRKRINATIREGQKATNYYLGAFVAGLLISFIELACTGQIYFPVIVAMMSVPDLKAKAISYLLLYNLMFIVPLVVVFILAYNGTTSKDLTNFLKKHAATVKIGMAVLFLALAIWLMTSLF
ncbi:MAG: cytochrome c biogenesis protein CcdA, partial [Anaerolineaceae bacterium]